MKPLHVLLLFLAPLAYGRWFGDMVGERAWIPTPDGYVWDEKGAVELNPTDVEFSRLPPALFEAFRSETNAFRGGIASDTIPASTLMIKADLNGDGSPEYFIPIPEASGTGGYSYVIFSTSDGKTYHCIGGIQGQIILHPAKVGWASLEVIGRGGATRNSRSLMRFDGDGYRYVRMELHDFSKEQVIVRKVEPTSTPAAKTK